MQAIGETNTPVEKIKVQERMCELKEGLGFCHFPLDCERKTKYLFSCPAYAVVVLVELLVWLDPALGGS